MARVAVALGEPERANLTIVTPSLPVINEVSSWTDPHLVVVGGLFLPNYMTCVAPQAVDSLQAVSADITVMGGGGADSSKIGRRGFTAIAPISAIHTLITDDGADPGELESLSRSGIDVHVV